MTSVVRPLPGAGLVTRSGELMLVCGEGEAGVGALLDLVGQVTAAGGDGGVLVRRVAAALAADFDGFSACAACGPTADGRLAVLVHGAATARVVGGDGEVVLSAADAITSVSRLVPGPISSVRLELPGAGQPSQFARLDSGVVAAAGFLAEQIAPSGLAPSGLAPSGPPPSGLAPSGPPPLLPAPARAVDAAPGWPPSADQAPPPPVSPPWVGPTSLDATYQSSGAAQVPAPAPDQVGPDPLPIRSGLATEALGAPGKATVLGLACPNGHLNDPSAASCSTCDASLAGVPPTLREGSRPPLGVLTLDDGSAYVLDIAYVLGREPQHDPEVVAGSARPLKISDSEGVVSRRHLRVALNGWDIQVVDLGSANGTYVQYPGESQLHQLTANHPVEVGPGTQVTMGRRWFRIDPVPRRA